MKSQIMSSLDLYTRTSDESGIEQIFIQEDESTKQEIESNIDWDYDVFEEEPDLSIFESEELEKHLNPDNCTNNTNELNDPLVEFEVGFNRNSCCDIKR